MNTLTTLIGMIIIFGLGLWIALTMAELVLVILGWVLVGAGVVGIIYWILNNNKSKVNNNTTTSHL